MSNKSYKSEIAKGYIEKFSNLSTMAISRLLVKDYPVDFDNVEQARAMVREYRDGRRKIPSIRTEKEKKQAMAKFQLIESDYEELIPYNLPSSYKKILIMNDVHIPYQDNEALLIAINHAKEEKVDAIYLNGDIMDLYQASRFDRDRRLRDLEGELELTRVFLRQLVEFFQVPIYYKLGNHEDRWEIYLRQKASELLGINEFKLSNLLRFGELGIIEIKSRQMANAGKLSILHGHEFGHSVFSPVNPARGLYMRAKENSIIGHHHQTSEHTEKSLNGKVVTTWSVGALCGLQPEYLPYNKWNHGFAIVEMENNGDFEVHNHKIIMGKVR